MRQELGIRIRRREHDLVAGGRLIERVLQPFAALKGTLKNGPEALKACKDLIRAVANRPITAEVVADTAARIAAIRTTPEAQEGMAAFLQRRKPNWVLG